MRSLGKNCTCNYEHCLTTKGNPCAPRIGQCEPQYPQHQCWTWNGVHCCDYYCYGTACRCCRS